MRRIQQYTRELPYERAVVILSKRDYELMRNVIRAAGAVYDAQDKNESTRTIANCHLTNQFALFERGGKKL